MQLRTRATGATKAIEIGTLRGYSGTGIAWGLAPGGKLIALEHSSKHADVARETFRRAGVADRIEIRIGDARQTSSKIAREALFDLCFIDADGPATTLISHGRCGTCGPAASSPRTTPFAAAKCWRPNVTATPRPCVKRPSTSRANRACSRPSYPPETGY